MNPLSEKTVWDKLKAKGFSDAACASIMGNIQAESAFISNNVEDRYERDTGKTNEYYTMLVDDGRYSKNDFMFDQGHAYGYGLCQWTYPTRKAALYNLAKERGVSIADEQMQIDFLMLELETEFRSVLDLLIYSSSINEMTKKFMCTYENPFDQSDGAIYGRVQNAQTIYNKYAGSAPDEPDDEDESEEQDIIHPDDRRTFLHLEFGDGFGNPMPQVKAWQNLLLCWDKNIGIHGADGKYGEATREATMEWQREVKEMGADVEVNGVVDEDDWIEIINVPG